MNTYWKQSQQPAEPEIDDIWVAEHGVRIWTGEAWVLAADPPIPEKEEDLVREIRRAQRAFNALASAALKRDLIVVVGEGDLSHPLEVQIGKPL
jgi:hypothetical protein